VGILGSYTGTCHLQGDTQKGCKLPDTCENTIVTLQGVIYVLNEAVRVSPRDESTLAPGCPLVDLECKPRQEPPPESDDTSESDNTESNNSGEGVVCPAARRILGSLYRTLLDSNAANGTGNHEPLNGLIVMIMHSRACTAEGLEV
jgi:hypothetical protein